MIKSYTTFDNSSIIVSLRGKSLMLQTPCIRLYFAKDHATSKLYHARLERRVGYNYLLPSCLLAHSGLANFPTPSEYKNTSIISKYFKKLTFPPFSNLISLYGNLKSQEKSRTWKTKPKTQIAATLIAETC